MARLVSDGPSYAARERLEALGGENVGYLPDLQGGKEKGKGSDGSQHASEVARSEEKRA